MVAGRSTVADIVLTKLTGVSRYHFALTFDAQKFLIVKDLDSTVGTRVIYDGEDVQRGHGVDWSACGPGLTRGKAPTIKVVGELQLRLVVPDHDVTSQTYLDNVARFLQGTAGAEDLFSDLNLMSRTQTELFTAGEPQILSTQIPGPILWRKELARGSFAVVSYAWDVTSRAEYALKEPLKGKGGHWAREAEILKSISHNHIVALKYATLSPTPQLYFEYVSGGSLQAYPSPTTAQRRQVAIQLLDGLAYLHKKKPPIVHRDIKPENVLVEHWGRDRVHVKLADFGLSKQADQLETFCGTVLYAAPEIFSARPVRGKDASKYDPLVDNWSLAVLLVQLECGRLPTYYSERYTNSATAWGEAMAEFASSYLVRHGPNDLLSLLVEDMLVMDPRERQTAGQCHEKALRLFGANASAPETRDNPRPLLDGGEDSGEESSPATPRALPASAIASASSPCQDALASKANAIGEEDSQGLQRPRFQRSDAPAPDSFPHTSVIEGGPRDWDIDAATTARGSASGSGHGGNGQCLAGGEEGTDATAASRRKRPKIEENQGSEAVQQ